MVNKLKSYYPNYENIYITKKYGEAHEFVLFYWPWDPLKYQNDPSLGWDYHANWYWVNNFDKFKFINDWEITSQEIPSNSLLISSPQNYPNINNAKLIDSVSFLNGQKAFEFIKYE